MKSSILGTTQIYIQSVADASKYATLNNSIITKINYVSNDIIHESELGKTRVAIDRGSFIEFDIMIHLYKYTSSTDKTLYELLNTYFYKKTLNMKLHTDAGFIVKYGTSTAAVFYCLPIEIRPIQPLNTEDIITLKLISLDECDLPRI